MTNSTATNSFTLCFTTLCVGTMRVMSNPDGPLSSAEAGRLSIASVFSVDESTLIETSKPKTTC